jgi:uncharacterized protein
MGALSNTIDIMEGVLRVVQDWSFWDASPPKGVEREADTPEALSDRICLVVKGARRAGKSTLLQQMLRTYQLNPKHCAFLNFEDPRLSNNLSFELLQALHDEFRAARGSQPTLTFFLDEIQWVSGWERWLRTQLERPKRCQYVITGSNAQLLSGELGSALTGRHLSVELFPFSWTEFQRARPRGNVGNYLSEGGFPEVVLAKDGARLLRQYFHDVIERDVRERVAARSSQPLRQLVQMVYESAGSEISVRRLASATGIAVETAQSYLEACESAYLIFGCQFFSYSQRKRANYNKKYYPIDTSLRDVVASKTGADKGKRLECATYLALRRSGLPVFYWRSKGEVDFVVQHKDGTLTPIQVTLDQPLERHLRGLEEFYETFPQAKEAVVVTQRSFGLFAQQTLT